MFKIEVFTAKLLYFDLKNPNPMSIFVGPEWKNCIIRNYFSGLSTISDTAAEFPCGSLQWDSLSAFGASLRPTLLAIEAIAPSKTLLRSGKNDQLLLRQEVIIHQN